MSEPKSHDANQMTGAAMIVRALIDRIAKREVDPYTAASDILSRALK